MGLKKDGGYNHRYSFVEILIKDNHIKAENNLKTLIEKAIITKKIVTVEIENSTLKQLNQIFLSLKFKRILFDKLEYKTIKKLFKNL